MEEVGEYRNKWRELGDSSGSEEENGHEEESEDESEQKVYCARVCSIKTTKVKIWFAARNV